jgi:hypothetical protein
MRIVVDSRISISLIDGTEDSATKNKNRRLAVVSLHVVLPKYLIPVRQPLPHPCLKPSIDPESFNGRSKGLRRDACFPFSSFFVKRQ